MVEFNLILMEVHLAALSQLKLNVHVRFDFCVDDAAAMMKVYLCICVVVFLRSTYYWCSTVMVL